VSIAASDGRGYAPRDGFHRVLTPTETHYFRTPGTFEVEVPAGPVTIQARKGLEFRPVLQTVEVPAGGRVEAVLELDRLVDAREAGWHSGDTHVHDLHQGRFGLTHADFFNDLVSEDLRVSFALIHMDGTRLMGRWDDLTGQPHPLSTGEHILQYAQEFRGSFGHVGLAGVKEFIMPLVGGAANTPFAADVLNADYLAAAREQGATGGFMHPFSGLVALPDYIGVSEIPVDVALGVGDFYDVICFWYDELNNAEIYYRLLNAGFRLAATGGTDNFSDVWRDPGPGASRTYARVEGELTVDSWLEAVRERQVHLRNAGRPEDADTIGRILEKEGEQGVLRWSTARLLKRARNEDAHYDSLAILHAWLGERDTALHWLEEAIRVKRGVAMWAKVHPAFDELRSESRFHELLDGMGVNDPRVATPGAVA